MKLIGVSWLLLAGAYGVLVGPPSLVESIAALVCGGLGTVWVRQIGRCGDRHFRLTRSALTPVVGAIATMPRATLQTGGSLLTAIATGHAKGRDRLSHELGMTVPLAGDDPEIATSRGIGVLAASLAPDAFVLRLEPQRGGILVHELCRSDGRDSL